MTNQWDRQIRHFVDMLRASRKTYIIGYIACDYLALCWSLLDGVKAQLAKENVPGNGRDLRLMARCTCSTFGRGDDEYCAMHSNRVHDHGWSSYRPVRVDQDYRDHAAARDYAVDFAMFTKGESAVMAVQTTFHEAVRNARTVEFEQVKLCGRPCKQIEEHLEAAKMELTELLEHRAHVMTRKEGANIDWVRWPIAEASRAQLQNIADNFLADTALLDFFWDQCQGCVQYQVEHGVQRGFVKLSISKLAEHTTGKVGM